MPVGHHDTRLTRSAKYVSWRGQPPLASISHTCGTPVGVGFYNPRTELALRLFGPPDVSDVDGELRTLLDRAVQNGVFGTKMRSVIKTANPDGVRAKFARRRPASSTPLRVNFRPQFQGGDRVRARNIHPEGHTRLPRYVRGKTGTIARYYGIHNLQDAELPGGCVRREQPLYAVRFESRDLWGESTEAEDAVYLDMWEGYLTPVQSESE